MDKKGLVGDYMLENLPRIFFLVIIIIVTVLTVQILSGGEVDTKDVRAETLFNRLVYSPNLFWKTTETNNTLPGVIVMSEFESETISSAIDYEADRYAAAKLSVKDIAGNTEKTAYMNRQGFERWNPLTGMEGQGGASRYVKEIPVRYEDEGSKSQGTLEVEIVIPHS